MEQNRESSSRFTMSCDEVERQLDSYLDDCLGMQELVFFETHLCACTTCTQLVAEIRCIRDTARTLVEAEIPAGVSERLRQRLAEETDWTFRRNPPQLHVVK